CFFGARAVDDAHVLVARDAAEQLLTVLRSDALLHRIPRLQAAAGAWGTVDADVLGELLADAHEHVAAEGEQLTGIFRGLAGSEMYAALGLPDFLRVAELFVE